MLIHKHGKPLKKLKRLASKKNLDIWFQDECHFQQHGSRCAIWIPPEDTDPITLLAPTRKKIGVFGAVSVEDGKLVVSKQDKFNAEVFLAFLKELILHRKKGRKMIVILDNATWHHARSITIRPWLEENKQYIELFFLPSYSPDYNQIERVWKPTRRLCTHNRFFPNLEELIEAVFTQFRLWSQRSETFRRLCALT